jgi:hypothetical protein
MAEMTLAIFRGVTEVKPCQFCVVVSPVSQGSPNVVAYSVSGHQAGGLAGRSIRWLTQAEHAHRLGQRLDPRPAVPCSRRPSAQKRCCTIETNALHVHHTVACQVPASKRLRQTQLLVRTFRNEQHPAAVHRGRLEFPDSRAAAAGMTLKMDPADMTADGVVDERMRGSVKSRA